jgi:hypothetical protein
MRWEVHVACIGVTRNAYKIFVRNLMERDHSEELGVYGKISNRSLGNRVGRYGLVASSSGQGQMAGSCKHSNVPSGPIKGGEFLD